MKFRPFWELIADLGIVLPDPEKLKGKLRDRLSPSDGIHSARSPHSISSPQDLLELLSELAQSDLADLTAEEYLGTRLEKKRMPPGLSGDRCWIPPNQTIEIEGYKIPGMVYVGEELAAVNNSRASETSLINPRLKVKRDRPDYEGKQMPYSVSYSQMPPACRAAYLHWLSTGRCEPNIYIGYIWLFFYGLERRVFHDLLRADLKHDEAKRQELEQIMAEVERLNARYGGSSLSGGIRYKTETFLETCQVMCSTDLSKTIDPMTAKALSLQVGLGQLVEQNQPIPAHWALAWYSRLSSFRLPTATTRCKDEFEALFQLRYGQKYGEGMKIKTGKSKLTTVYYPASQSFWSRSVVVPIGNLPDITRFAAKTKKIGEVVETCRVELEPLSRYLGRNPEGRNTPGAIALLPPDLLTTHGGEWVKKLQTWLDQKFSKPEIAKLALPIAVVSGQELIQQWSGANSEKLTKAETTGLSKFLELLGYGIEPDMRLGGAAPSQKNYLGLFRLPAPNPLSLSNAYLEATLLAHLAIVAASGDAPPSATEQQYLLTHLAEWVALEEPERSRLAAHIQVLLSDKLTLRSLKARVEQIELQDRGAIGQFVVRVAAADGSVNPKEVQLLEKVYGLLELDTQTLYSDIHSLSMYSLSTAGGRPVSKSAQPAADLNQPITVRQAVPTAGHAIPPQPKKKQAAFALDMGLVESKLVESQEISNLLADIFVDTEGTPANRASQGQTSQIPASLGKEKVQTQKSQKRGKKSHVFREIAGLDVPHSALLLAIAQQQVWQREALEAIATQQGLMLDGALEVINEAAFDRSDEAVTEGHDSIEVNADVLREMLA
ncbi:MAG: TerB N-terminal domain-containing protein [Oscillatoriophycideae cyanobacterium NC_groundwater_1537_Pr4_S-0.65um_50_18]|nr:TerB N-terminal domain-containing protein [Oscillatoriophycideae cyanobacterium NC_groundwater_1537_Pr4_S-0.65um_50_18]